MARKQKSSRARSQPPLIRWLVVPLGLLLVAVAGYVLLTARPRPMERQAIHAKASQSGQAGRKTSEPNRPAVSAPAGKDQIGQESREELRRILREADQP